MSNSVESSGVTYGSDGYIIKTELSPFIKSVIEYLEENNG